MKSTKISILIYVCSLVGLLVDPTLALPLLRGGEGWVTSALAHERTSVRTHQILFWYPGEAGSTEEARGTIDIFFDYVNRHLAAEHNRSGAREGAEISTLAGATPRITGKYFNTVEEGLQFIKQARPKLGILSFAAYTIHKEKLGTTKVILQTLPLPDGKPTENYVVVGKGVAPDRALSSTLSGATPKASSRTLLLYTKQPLTREFVVEFILAESRGGAEPRRMAGLSPPKTGRPLRVAPTPSPLPSPQRGEGILRVPNILPTLKDVASGAKTGGVILQPMEYHTLKNLNQPWVKDLTVWHTSPPVPTAPLVVFGEPTPLVEKVKEILLKMPQDQEGREILQTLRLKGFTLASPPP